MATIDILKNAALGALKTTAGAMYPAATTAKNSISTIGSTLFGTPSNSAKSQLASLGSTGTQAGLNSGQKAAALSQPNPSSYTNTYGGGGGYSYSAPSTPDYTMGNYNYSGLTGNSTQGNYSNYNNTFTNDYTTTSGQTTPSNTPTANPYLDQLKALQDKINQYNEGLSQYLKPGQDETDAQSQLDALTAQQRNLASSTELGLSNIQSKPIALQFQQGQGAALQRQAAAQMGALGAQAEPLTTKLARLQASRQNAYQIAKNQLENVKGEYDTLQGQLKPLEVGGNLLRFNPATGSYDTIYSAPKNNPAAEGFTLSEGQMRYDANGNLIAGAPKSPQEQYTNDIKEYNFAKSQGYGGSFTDYQQSKQGGSSGNLPSAYREFQLTQSDPAFARYLQSQAGSKPLTQDQFRAADFASRMQGADQVINQLANVGASNYGGITQYLPNVLKSSERQQLEQAQRTFVNAVLRRESGAAISPSEFNSASQQYFPQPGDSPSVIQQKSRLRSQVIQNMQAQAGGGGQNYGGGGGDPLDRALSAAGFKSPLSMGLKGSYEQKFPTGATGGQCASFARKIANIPPLGNGLNDKKAHVNRIGMPAAVWKQNPQIGDVIISNDNPTYGHVAVVNEVLPNGMVRVTESNYRGDEKVTHTRLVSINSPRIYGAIHAQPKV